MAENSAQSSHILLISKKRPALDLPWTGRENHNRQLESVGSGWEALERVHASPRPDLVLLDLVQGDSDGLHTLRWLRRVRPDLPVLVLASSDDPDQKREAIRLGAEDFIIQPLQPRQLETAIRRSLCCFDTGEGEAVTGEIEHIDDDIFFASPTMRRLRAQAELLAQVNAPVLISGEIGSGKELVAHLIHKLSIRSGFRFITINCSAMPGDMLESELFGVMRNGRPKASALEVCQIGTLFLDQLTEMPMSLQTKLLHILRDGHFVRFGGDTQIKMDVRILAAMEINVEQAIAERKLREDLYYRLSAFTVHVPALRQRKEEIPLLLGCFMNRLSRRYRVPVRKFSTAALDACQRHSWPGNLRELERFVKNYLVLGEGMPPSGTLDRDGDIAFWHAYLSQAQKQPGLTNEATEPQSGISGLKSLVQSVKEEVERNVIASALDQTGWNRKVAARLLKVSYRTLLYKIEQYHMSPLNTHFPGYGHSGSYRERELHKGIETADAAGSERVAKQVHCAR